MAQPFQEEIVLRFALAAGLAGLVATAVAAQPSARNDAGAPEPATNSSTTADASAADPDKIICRNVKPPTGTRVASGRNRQRICLSKAEWDIQEREAQEQARMAINEGRNTSKER